MVTSDSNPHINLGYLPQFFELGYIPSDLTSNSVSMTLEYSFDNWAVGACC